MVATQFSSLPLADALQQNLQSLGFGSMTPIQANSLPPMLAGHDVIGQAKTGSGKTAAYGLALLNALEPTNNAVQALVICPTRELADQVTNELRRLARAMPNVRILPLCGGVPNRIQTASLQRGTHVAVGTPGRLEEHLRNERLLLAELKTLVLDEADRMLEMGFEPQINQILHYVPANRQTLLFSATFPRAIEATAKRILREPITIKVESTHDEASIKQHFYPVETEAQRLRAVPLLLLNFRPSSAVIFCNTKQATVQVTGMLMQQGFSAALLNGDLEQRDRDETLLRFANGSISTLVATDVAARGLDIDQLPMVINYEVSHDPEVHTHRVGRTGRAGSSGLACTLFSPREHDKLATAIPGAVEQAEPLPPETVLRREKPLATIQTIIIESGKKQKIRPGDILGALTSTGSLPANAIGKIKITPIRSYVAVASHRAVEAAELLNNGKLKGRSCRARILRG